jgi:hypothetical protein
MINLKRGKMKLQQGVEMLYQGVPQEQEIYQELVAYLKTLMKQQVYMWIACLIRCKSILRLLLKL